MYKGDISNSMPKRVLVNADILIVKMPTTKKKFKIFKVKSHHLVFDRFLLNKFFQYATRMSLTLELVSFEYKPNELEVIYNDLDRAGLNPFRAFMYYPSPKKLVSDLPYRPEVLGVIDPEHQLMYGRWGLDF